MKKLPTILCTLSILVTACGSDEPTSESESEIDRSVELSALTESEHAILCEATLAAQGGPGEVFDCGDGSSFTNNTMAECLAELESLSNCDLVVGDVEDCATAASNGCDLEAIFSSAACQKIFNCQNE
jgi:hypothetical protein